MQEFILKGRIIEPKIIIYKGKLTITFRMKIKKSFVPNCYRHAGFSKVSYTVYIKRRTFTRAGLTLNNYKYKDIMIKGLPVIEGVDIPGKSDNNIAVLAYDISDTNQKNVSTRMILRLITNYMKSLISIFINKHKEVAA